MPVGSELAMVFLYMLALDGGLVGMSLGVLLPSLFPGVCFGALLALLIGCFMTVSNAYFFPIAGGVLAAVFGIFSAR